MTLVYRRALPLLLLIFLVPAAPALALFGIGENPEMAEQERQETLQRIEDVQQKLKLLQDKLKALERRKAAEAAAQPAGDKAPAGPIAVNWVPVDATVVKPGEFGLYTYLLYNGSADDKRAIGSLEDLLLTIETLPPSELPESLANRFLVPVEQPQSTVDLGRQAYNFKLSETYLDRLQLRDDLPQGPVLVSLPVALDPFGADEVPPFMAVSFGRQQPEQALQLVRLWHEWEQEPVAPSGHPLSGLFWTVLDQTGTLRVTAHARHLLLELPAQP